MPPSHTRIFLTILRIAIFHGCLLRILTSWSLLRVIYELLRVITTYLRCIYRLLWVITMCLRKKSTISYELSRITTSCLRIVTSILRNVTIHQSFYVFITTCLRVVTNTYELVMSIYESLWFFANKYINPANLNVSSFDNWQLTSRETYERNRLQLYQIFLQFPQIVNNT